MQFLVEAVALSSWRVLGIVLAIGAAIGLAGSWRCPSFQPQDCGDRLPVLPAVGVVFGYFPARRAARLTRSRPCVGIGWPAGRACGARLGHWPVPRGPHGLPAGLGPALGPGDRRRRGSER